MFSTVQQLCELEHVLSARKLKLTTVSFLKFSLPDEYRSPSSPSLTALVSAGIWVVRGNGLKVTFCFDTEGIPNTVPDRTELTEALAVLLQDAETWKQLGFQVALTIPIECQADDEQRPDFVLDLTLADPHGTTNTMLKTGGTQVMAYDSRPPNGIVTAYLEEVTVKLSFSHIPASNLVRKRKANDTNIDLDRNRLYDRWGGTLDSTTFIDRRSHVQEPRYQKVIQDNLFSVMLTYSALDVDDDAMLDTDSSSQDSVVSSSSQASISSYSTRTSLRSLGSTGVSTNKVLGSNKMTIGDFARLIDSAFRMMICGERSPSAKDVSCSRSSGGPMLAEIAPALFCPGYQLAMAQRNGLASSIARSITSIHRRSKSSNFRLDIQRMSILSLEERLRILRGSLGVGTNDQSHFEMTAAIELRLWQVSQRTLFNPSIVRQLKPMQYCSGRALREDTLSRVMLDEDVLIPHSANPPAEEDDHLLFDDGPSNTSFLSFDDDIQDENILFDDLYIDDDYDLLDTDEYWDESPESLLFDLDEHDDLDFTDLEKIEHWKSINGSCDIEKGTKQELLYQEKSTALDISVEEDYSMLEDCT